MKLLNAEAYVDDRSNYFVWLEGRLHEQTTLTHTPRNAVSDRIYVVLQGVFNGNLITSIREESASGWWWKIVVQDEL